MSIDGSGASRGGGDGLHNEDAFLVEEGLGLYLVCDGASDNPAGEVAARIVRDAVAASIARSEQDLDVRRGRIARFAVEKAMNHAMRELAAMEGSNPELRGLSASVTVLLAHGLLGIIGHRGDSRAYLIRHDRAHQLTIDHALTESVGSESPQQTAFEVFAVDLRAGDTIVLCTDGAEHVVEDASITRVAGDLSPRVLSSRIVSAALHRDPNVDATAVVVRVQGQHEPGWLELSQPPHGTEFGHTMELAQRYGPRSWVRKPDDGPRGGRRRG